MIYIVKHRDYHNPVPDTYVELGVGDKYDDEDRDNINELNPYINEMTGLYDMWKNHDDKYVGLCHYRRFFRFNNEPASLELMKKYLDDVDIILAPKVNFNMTLYWQLRFEVEDSEYLDKYLNEYYKYEPGFKEFIEKEKGFCNREMFVCKRELMEKYCEWVFPIVIPIATKFMKEDLNKPHINTRLVSHIAERFFYYWVVKNNLSVYNWEYMDI